MTLLGYVDGDSFQSGASYLDLVEFLLQNGARVNEDLEELWRRIVFSIAISNTDDHLRNHGFILTDNGWKLSPAYDLNPVQDGTGLKLNISENDNALSIDLAYSVKDLFRISDKKAGEVVKTIKAEVSKWKTIAKNLGMPRNEQEHMSRAFSRIKYF